MRTLMLLVLLAQAPAQNPGDKVEYRAQRWPETWEVGVFIKPLPGGTQVLIREKPSQFYPEGFERAYALADVRPVSPAPPPTAAATDAQPATTQPTTTQPTTTQPTTTQRTTTQRTTTPNETQRPETPPNATQRTTPSNDTQRSPFTEQAILDFLSAQLGPGDPFANPKREQVLQQLRTQVLARGVSFRYATLGPFSDALGKYGATSSVRAPLAQNFGPPATVASLTGAWKLMKVGAPMTRTVGNETRSVTYFGDSGGLTIDPAGSYDWGGVKGTWRKATPEELALSDKGGEGIVLLQAKSGADWLVFGRDEGGPEGKGILVIDLATRNMRERGVR